MCENKTNVANEEIMDESKVTEESAREDRVVDSMLRFSEALTGILCLVCAGFFIYACCKIGNISDDVAKMRSELHDIKWQQEVLFGHAGMVQEAEPEPFVDETALSMGPLTAPEEPPREMPFLTLQEMAAARGSVPLGVTVYDDFTWDELDFSEGLKLDEHFRLGMSQPVDDWSSDTQIRVNVFYPGEVKAGETGEIKVYIQDKSTEVVEEATYEFVAAEDFYLMHGSRPGTSSSFDSWMVRECVTFEFYTAEEEYQPRRYQGQTGAHGSIDVNYYRQ